MNRKLRYLTLASVAAAVLVLPAPMAGEALAQIPAFLPTKDSVQASEPLPIDGDWRISTIGKVIRIEGGRAYAMEPWLHAFVLQVQPNMVVLQDIRQTGDGRYSARDLPLVGNASLRRVSADQIDVEVPGLLGTLRYSLFRIAEAQVNRPAVMPAEDAAVGWGQGDAFNQRQGPDEAASSPPPMFISPGAGAEAGNAPPVARSETVHPLPVGNFRPIEMATLLAPQVAPDEAYRPCAAVAAGPDGSAPDTAIDDGTQLRFAAPAVEAETGNDADLADDCWARLDGVWQELDIIAHDSSLNDGSQWGVAGTPLAALTNGVYTTLEHLYVPEGSMSDSEFHIMSAIDGAQYIQYVSSDGLTLEEVLVPRGPRKTYVAQGDASLGRTLTIDVAPSGRIRLRIGDREFVRPEPLQPPSDMNADESWNIQYNLQNVAASRRGYDILTQDPFLLMDNDKLEIFAQPESTDYVIDNRRLVPAGYRLLLDDLQGNVYRRTLMSSEAEVQNSISNSFGVNAKISVSGAVNSAMALVGMGGQVADTSASAGYSETTETVDTMRSSNSVGQLMGYSRDKQYALVVDYPNARLSSDFTDAVGDLERFGDYEGFIRKFGTHYPYAVTYGAAARLSQTISEESYSQSLQTTNGNAIEAQLNIMESGIGGFTNDMQGGLSGTQNSIGNDGGQFLAVGGNGSWDQNGYMAGETPYPILMDLRPIDELLNPINFPDQPEVYSTLRANLGLAINTYLASATPPLRDNRLIDQVTYTGPVEEDVDPADPIEEWHISISNFSCHKAALGTTTGAEATVSISAVGPSQAQALPKQMEVRCRLGRTENQDYSYRVRPSTEGLLILRGTREELEQYDIQFSVAWKYKPGFRTQQANLTHDDVALQNGGLSGPGHNQTVRWLVSPSNSSRPLLQMTVRYEFVSETTPEGE